jgi:hypothetical protein
MFASFTSLGFTIIAGQFLPVLNWIPTEATGPVGDLILVEQLPDSLSGKTQYPSYLHGIEALVRV